VLLIDGDCGSRACTLRWETSAPGLGDYLLGESDEFSIMQRGPWKTCFSFRVDGTWRSPELIANGRLKMLMQRVEALFDWIVVDSPPAVPVSDASQLANFCDGVLMVVAPMQLHTTRPRRLARSLPGNPGGCSAEWDHSCRFVPPVLLRSLREDSQQKA